MSDFQNRANIQGKLDALIGDICEKFGLGVAKSFNIIEVGYEDLNIKLETSVGEYLIKIFSKKRDKAEVNRFVDTVTSAIAAGVSHPALYKDNLGNVLYTNYGISAVVTQFINGHTFYDIARAPNNKELELIVKEAVKINKMSYDPPYIFDSWAIPNMEWMFEKTKDHLSAEGLVLVQKAFDVYNSILFDGLPKCFVHGDIIKSNVIKADDGSIYIVDFSVANVYPRIQELAVMAANLLFEEKADQVRPLKDRVDKLIGLYLKHGGDLIQLEIDNVFNCALAGAAMEYMGSVNERMKGDDSEHTAFWEKQGLSGLKEALL